MKTVLPETALDILALRKVSLPLKETKAVLPTNKALRGGDVGGRAKTTGNTPTLETHSRTGRIVPDVVKSIALSQNKGSCHGPSTKSQSG